MTLGPLPSRPLVSVIVPSYNQGKFISETLDSILAQDYRPIEVLVLDGDSTDGTLSVLELYRGRPEMRICSEPDHGVVDAVNKGLRESRGAILAIQSSDDIYLPGAISAAVAAFAENREVGMVFGDVEHIDEESRVTGRDILSSFDLAEYLGRLTYVPQASAFLRSEAAREVGAWRPEVSYAPDADYCLRIALRFPVLKLDRAMARYRYHPDQRDRHRHRILRDWEKVADDLRKDPAMTARLRRFARMGVHLARYRYTPEQQWLSRTLHLYRAVLAHPPSMFHRHFPRRELFPGRAPVWSLLSRCKRMLGIPPRNA